MQLYRSAFQHANLMANHCKSVPVMLDLIFSLRGGNCEVLKEKKNDKLIR